MIRVPNLATRPLRNERLPAVLLGVALAGLLGLGVRHAFVLRELLPSRTAAVEGWRPCGRRRRRFPRPGPTPRRSRSGG